MNNTLANFRGHLIPIDPNTIAADSTGSYDLGSTDYRWRTVYAQALNASTATGNIPTWQKVTLAYTSFQTAAASASITAFSLPAKGAIQAVHIGNPTAFAGGGISAVNLTIGNGTDSEKYVVSLAVNTSTIAETYQAIGVEDLTAATNIIATLSATGANLDSLTAGQVDVYFLRGALE